MTKAYIVGGLQFSLEYERIKHWVEQTPNASFIPEAGVSWINGSTFYSAIAFEKREDLLACVLTFPGLVHADNR